MYRIPDEAMDRLLRDLDSITRDCGWYLSHNKPDSDVVGARNMAIRVREELATYKEE